MSKDEDKFKHSRRLQRDETAAKRQVKIAKNYGLNVEGSPHKYEKRHYLNCGNPNCVMCGNPRKMFNDPTQQEKRMYQDIDTVRNKHGNGIIPGDED